MTAELADDYYQVVHAPRNAHIRRVYSMSMEGWSSRFSRNAALLDLIDDQPVIDLRDSELDLFNARYLSGALAGISLVPFADGEGGVAVGRGIYAMYTGRIKDMLHKARCFQAATDNPRAVVDFGRSLLPA